MKKWWIAILPDVVFSGLIIAALTFLVGPANALLYSVGIGNVLWEFNTNRESISLMLMALAALVAAVRLMYTFEKGIFGVLTLQIAVYALAGFVCWYCYFPSAA